MSEKDTEIEKLLKNNSKKEYQYKTCIFLFTFSKLKKSANITLSDYNLFNYNFTTKSMLQFNTRKEPFKTLENENTNLNLIKNLNIELPSSEKLSQNNFYNEFMENYENSFANFCEIDKNNFIKAFFNKKYIPYLDKFGDIKISIKNLLDLLKCYSPSLKLKIRRRFIKKYKKKKIFKTTTNKLENTNKINNYMMNNLNKINKEGLKKISLKKNLKISVKNNNNEINNNNTTEKENFPEGNLNFNFNNNLLNNISILNNDIIKSSILSLQPPSNNLLQNTDNFFSFSLNDQNKFFNFNNTNNNTNQASLATNQLLNKKRAYTPFTPYTPIMNNNNQNINKKNNNQFNFNIPTLYGYNPIISPQILSPYKDFLTPISQGDLSSPPINMPNDKFTFTNIRNTNSFLFGGLNNLNNQNSFLFNNNLNLNPTYYNLTNIDNNNNQNQNNNNNYIMSPNISNFLFK